MLTGVPFVGVGRGERLESIHAVAACATDATGNVLLSMGTIDEPIFVRSCAKPFITAAAVRAGIVERFHLDQRELSVMSASHNGEPFHVEAVRSILAKIGATEADLQCGTHAPAYPPAARALAASGGVPRPVHNNCSGKHAGVLALARMIDAPLSGYLLPDHPAQRTILALCERLSNDRFTAATLAIDGCGMPVYAISLRNLAHSFARFAAPTECDPADAAALSRVRAAIIAHPEYLAGTQRFDTALICAGDGRIVGKAGAEGVHATALLAGGVGVALKIVDGAQRAAPVAALALLRRLGALSDSQCSDLAEFARTPVFNLAGTCIGHIAPLEPAA